MSSNFEKQVCGTIDQEKMLEQSAIAIQSIECLEFLFKPPFVEYCNPVRFEHIKNNALETINIIASFCDLEAFFRLRLMQLLKIKRTFKETLMLYIKNMRKTIRNSFFSRELPSYHKRVAQLFIIQEEVHRCLNLIDL